MAEMTATPCLAAAGAYPSPALGGDVVGLLQCPELPVCTTSLDALALTHRLAARPHAGGVRPTADPALRG